MRPSPLTRLRAEIRTVTVAAYLLAQLSIAIGAVIRIPLVASAVGLSGLGQVAASGAVIPLLLVPGAALRVLARTWIPASKGGVGQLDAVMSLGVSSVRALGLVEVSIALGVFLMRPSIYGPTDERLAVLFIVVAAVLALDGMWWWGVLEAQGREAAPNLAIVVTTAGGTVVTAVLSLVTDSVSVFIVANGATSTVPMMIVSFLGRRNGLKGRNRVPNDGQKRAFWRAIGAQSIRSLTDLGARGFDPIFVQVFLGAAAVGAFSVAQRMGSMVPLVALAMLPRMSATFAGSRSGGSLSAGQLDLQGRSLRLGLLALAAGAPLILFGPSIAALLAGNRSDYDGRLFIAIAILGVVTALEAPWGAAFASVEGITIVAVVALGATTLNLGLSIYLVQSVGVEGPIMASVAALAGLLSFEIWLAKRRPHLLTNPVDS